MNTNSIERFVDVGLYNRLVRLFELYRNPRPWLITSTGEFGAWKDLGVREFYDLIQNSEDAKVVRTIALFVWVTGFDSSDFCAKILKMMSEAEKLDVFLEVAMLSSPRCNQECKELFEKNLAGSYRDTALEYVVAMDAIGSKISKENYGVLSKVCAELVKAQGVSVQECFPVLCRMAYVYAEIGKEASELCKALYSLWTTVPKENSNAVGICEYFGMSYDDCLLFSYKMQRFDNKKRIVNSNKKFAKLKSLVLQRLLHSTKQWGDEEQSVVLQLLTDASLKDAQLTVFLNTNYFWMISHSAVAEDVLLNFRKSGWREQYLALSIEDRKAVVRNSLSITSDNDIRILWNEAADVVKDAFTEFDETSTEQFERLVNLGLFGEVGDNPAELLYWSTVFNNWKTRKSFEFAEYCAKEYGIRSEAMSRLFDGISTVDFDFLTEEEQDRLFEILNDYVFYCEPSSYRSFISENLELSELAKAIYLEAGGEDHE